MEKRKCFTQKTCKFNNYVFPRYIEEHCRYLPVHEPDLKLYQNASPNQNDFSQPGNAFNVNPLAFQDLKNIHTLFSLCHTQTVNRQFPLQWLRCWQSNLFIYNEYSSQILDKPAALTVTRLHSDIRAWVQMWLRVMPLHFGRTNKKARESQRWKPDKRFLFFQKKNKKYPHLT